MPKPNPWLDEVKHYLRKKFYQQVDFESVCYNQTFSYDTVRKCMYLIMRTSPDIYRHAAWLWATQRSRNDIAGGLNVDSSTIKRKFDAFAIQLLNYLIHPHIMPVLPPIDIRMQMEEEDKHIRIPEIVDGNVYTAADYLNSVVDDGRLH